MRPSDKTAELRMAAEAANQLINRLQEIVAEHLSHGEHLDETAAFYEIVETLETAREVARLRLALNDDPARFGDPTPFAAGDHTG
jgi:predicted house-cleaning noncanonical NTP pyrophosphatase (MazG superfamily)